MSTTILVERTVVSASCSCCPRFQAIIFVLVAFVDNIGRFSRMFLCLSLATGPEPESLVSRQGGSNKRLIATPLRKRLRSVKLGPGPPGGGHTAGVTQKAIDRVSTHVPWMRRARCSVVHVLCVHVHSAQVNPRWDFTSSSGGSGCANVH